MVIVCHLYPGRFSFGGEAAVAFFFMLSGFVLSKRFGVMVDNRSFSMMKFLRRQLAKFYPLHLTLLAAVVMIDALGGNIVEWWKLALSVLLLQSWIPTPSVCYVGNGVSWFLSTLLFLYVVFPWLYRRLMTMSFVGLLLATVSAVSVYFGIALSLKIPYIDDVLYVFPPLRIIDFGIGILIYRYCAFVLTDRKNAQQSIRWMQFLPPVITLVIAFMFFRLVDTPFRDTTLWLTIPPFIAWFVLCDTRGGRLMNLLHNRWIQQLATVSMPLYLSHMLTYRLTGTMMARASIDIDSLQGSLLIVVVCVAVSFLIKYLFIDKLSLLLIS